MGTYFKIIQTENKRYGYLLCHILPGLLLNVVKTISEIKLMWQHHAKLFIAVRYVIDAIHNEQVVLIICRRLANSSLYAYVIY